MSNHSTGQPGSRRGPKPVQRAARPQGTRLVWVAAGLAFVLGFESAGLQLALLRVAGEFDLGPAMMGALASAQYVAMLVIAPLFGMVSDRLGKKGIVLGAACLFTLGCVVTAFAQGALHFMVGVFLTGAGYCITESLIAAAIADAFPGKAERYMNRSQSLFGAGAVTAPLIIDWLITGFGFTWRAAFFLSAAGFALLLPVLATTGFVKASPQAPGKTDAIAGSGDAARAGTLWTLPFLLLLTAMFMYGGLEQGTASFSDSLFAIGLGRPQLGVYSLSLFWLAIMTTRILSTMVRLNTKRVLILGHAIAAGCAAVLALSTSPALSLAALCCMGLAMGPLWGMLQSLATREFPHRTGTAVTLMSAACGAGAALLPLLVGSAAQAWNVPTAYWVDRAHRAAGVFRLLLLPRAETAAARRRRKNHTGGVTCRKKSLDRWAGCCPRRRRTTPRCTKTRGPS